MGQPREKDAPDDGTEASPLAAPFDPQRAGRAPLDQAAQLLLRPLCDALERIEAKLAGAGGPLPPDRPDGTANDRTNTEIVVGCVEKVASRLLGFREETLRILDQITEALAAQRQEAVRPAAAEDRGEETWERILLGEELCQEPALASFRRQFLDQVMFGDGAARALAAQMMLVQTATVDQLPELLKPVGEAYYRWHPRATSAEDPLEKALAGWLTRRAEAAGLHNSIQIVRPGERFDASRHVAAGRGVQIVAVHGWVVLRDGNKVYTKANVSVK